MNMEENKYCFRIIYALHVDTKQFEDYFNLFRLKRRLMPCEKHSTNKYMWTTTYNQYLIDYKALSKELRQFVN